MFIPLIDDIEIDRETHLVKDAKHNIHLTKLEFGLLDFLATHANRVCTRNDLLDHVWGERFMYDTGTIDVHLNALRRKMGWNNKTPIETLRGIGFVFHTKNVQTHQLSPLLEVSSQWINAHSGDFAAHGLTIEVALTPWVNELTIHPDNLHRWLDASLDTLLPTAQPGVLRLSSRLTIHYFSLKLDINGTNCELNIPILRNT